MIDSQSLQTIKECNTPVRLSILNMLSVMDSAAFSIIKNRVMVPSKNISGKFAYQMRKLTRQKLVIKSCNGQYQLSEKGKFFIKLVESLQEKFITENQDEICKNAKAGEHQYITVCRFCSKMMVENGI